MVRESTSPVDNENNVDPLSLNSILKATLAAYNYFTVNI
jgi:hypothetical protein